MVHVQEENPLNATILLNKCTFKLEFLKVCFHGTFRLTTLLLVSPLGCSLLPLGTIISQLEASVTFKALCAT